MAIITAYCEDAQGLKLGPGDGRIQTPGALIVFDRHYATFDEADFPDWRSWLAGAPNIEILSEGEVPVTDPTAVVCPTCGKGFASRNQLNGHRMSHARQAAAATAAAAPIV